MNNKTGVVSFNWDKTLELLRDSRIDSVGLNERVDSLATRSIKKIKIRSTEYDRLNV